MGGEDKLHIGIQVAYHADELLLPFDVQGASGSSMKEYAVVIVTHQHGPAG